jgi:hypothetical protein
MKKVFALLSIAALFGIFWARSAPQEDNALAFNRLWLSHIPQHERDKVSIYLLLEEEAVGIFQESSVYQGDYDLFSFKTDGNALLLTMLQSQKKAKATYKASRCNERGFDYCIEIKGNPRGPARYYSRKGWEVDSTEEARALSQKLLPGLVE